jgi:hypothetical protein
VRQGIPGTLLILSLSSLACGYTLAGRGALTDPTIKKIGVPLFKDVTGKPGLDQKITEKVIEELLKRGHFDVIQGSTGVNALVVGEITGYTVAPVGFADPSKTITEANRYSITVTARVKYVKEGVTEPIWSNDAFSFKDEYDLGRSDQLFPETTGFFDREDQAIERLSTDFARTLVTNMLEAF